MNISSLGGFAVSVFDNAGRAPAAAGDAGPFALVQRLTGAADAVASHGLGSGVLGDGSLGGLLGGGFLGGLLGGDGVFGGGRLGDVLGSVLDGGFANAGAGGGLLGSIAGLLA